MVETEDDQLTINKARSRGGMYNMAKIIINEGSVLEFSKDENVTASVMDTHEIEFEGQATSLTAVALIVIKRLGYT